MRFRSLSQVELSQELCVWTLKWLLDKYVSQTKLLLPLTMAGVWKFNPKIKHFCLLNPPKKLIQIHNTFIKWLFLTNFPQKYFHWSFKSYFAYLETKKSLIIFGWSLENLTTVRCASASSSDMLPSLMFSVELVLSSIQSENQQEQKKRH